MHQRTLARLAGRLGPDGPGDDARWHVADLFPEPDNPHDPNAIEVVVGGEHVGYIARDRTELYHPFLRWARAAGWDGVSCRARIMGGFRFDDGGRAHLGIGLHHTMPLVEIGADEPLLGARERNVLAALAAPDPVER